MTKVAVQELLRLEKWLHYTTDWEHRPLGADHCCHIAYGTLHIAHCTGKNKSAIAQSSAVTLRSLCAAMWTALCRDGQRGQEFIVQYYRLQTADCRLQTTALFNCPVLYCTALCCTALLCSVLNYAALHCCTAIYSTVSHCTLHLCTALHETEGDCTAIHGSCVQVRGHSDLSKHLQPNRVLQNTLWLEKL